MDQCVTATCLGTTGFTAPGFSAAPYTLIVTVNRVSLVRSESAPSLNSAMLIDSLSVADLADPAPYDMLSQMSAWGTARAASALLRRCKRLARPHPSCEPSISTRRNRAVGFASDVTESYSVFGLVDGVSGKETAFYGTIGTLSVNRVSAPEPGTSRCWRQALRVSVSRAGGGKVRPRIRAPDRRVALRTVIAFAGCR
jgi:hypothetical protein